jgi:hypothetical protein
MTTTKANDARCDEHGLEVEAQCDDCGMPLCEQCVYVQGIEGRVCAECLDAMRDRAETLKAIQEDRNRRLERTLFTVARDMGRLTVGKLPND